MSNDPNESDQHFKECPEHEDYICPNLGCLDSIIYDRDGEEIEDCEEQHDCSCEDIRYDIEADAADQARDEGLV